MSLQWHWLERAARASLAPLVLSDRAVCTESCQTAQGRWVGHSRWGCVLVPVGLVPSEPRPSPTLVPGRGC